MHFPKPKVEPKESHLSQRIGLAANVITIAAGSAELIKMLVELWQTIPFGPGPRMPDEYHYLTSKIGPFYPSFPDKITPFTGGASSVDWRTARHIFDLATEILEDRDVDKSLRVTQSIELSNEIGNLLDTMQEQVREMLCEKIGDEAPV
jgi:hypothetical protein